MSITQVNELTYKHSSVATNFRPGTFEESNAAHDIEIHLVGEVLDLVGENSFKELTQYMTDSMQELKTSETRMTTSILNKIQTHKRFKITLFITSKRNMIFGGLSLLSSYKMTLKQQLNGAK